ncbi:MAG: bifunctional pyr operon transcriptional regulator/uracil phosphoribosyltransferase PyrR [Alphaproteobacteria bacterium]
MAQDKQIVLEKDELGRMISRMAHEIIEKTPSAADLVLIGIRSRGVHLARRIARKIEEIAKVALPAGTLDVSLYRDDRAGQPTADSGGVLEVPFAVDEKTVVLIDDVIFRGRTIRAAMEAVARLGQPKRILVAVLVDRGARELPIRADVVGKNVDAGEGERVNVLLTESDGIDQVTVGRWQSRGAI